MEDLPNPNDAIVSPFYPLCLYKDGSQFEWDGRATDTLTVDDSEAHDAALAKGWLEAADYGKSEPSSADRNAADIIASLPELALEALEKLKADETAGKARKGVLTAIDAAIDEKLKG